jgi:predicted ATPase
MSLPEGSDRDEQELNLQLSLAISWMDTAAPEREKAYVRALELCRGMGETYQVSRILGEGGLAVLYYVQAEHRKAYELADEALSLAQRAEDPLLEAMSHWLLGFISFSLGEYPLARDHFEQMISFYQPQQHHHPLVSLRGSDSGLSAMAYNACCLWCLGYPEQALKQSQEALALARKFNHHFTLADVLCYGGCLFHEMRRDADTLKDNAEELMRLSKIIGFPAWFGSGTYHRGAALAMLGQVQEGIVEMQQGIATRQSRGVRCQLPGTLRSLAEAQAKAGQPEVGLATLEEALALVEETDERHWEAELYQLKGELLLAQGDEAQAETSLLKAVEVARRQGAKSWELRAVISLARLWQAQGQKKEARQMLGEIYAWFTEGFDTPDLQQAKVLLEALS